MINIKTKDEIEVMKVGGKILSEVLSQVLKSIKPGVSEKDLDILAEKLILERGAEPGFKKVEDYNPTDLPNYDWISVESLPNNLCIFFKYTRPSSESDCASILIFF